MSVTLTHSVTHSFKPVTDYAALFFAQLPALGSVAVAGFALWFSTLQAGRFHRLVEQANTLAGSKLRSDEWERRFGAWFDLANAATAFIQKLVVPRQAGEDVFFTMSEQIAFDAAAERVFFLFPEDVTEAVVALRAALFAVRVTEAGVRSSEGLQRIATTQEFTRALTDAEKAREALKLAIRTYV